MDKHIFIINGNGGVGKDTFVEFVSTELNDVLKKFHTVINFSSVDKVKEIARKIGWDGKKSEKDRKFLSDLKILTSEYCDMPFKSMKNKVDEFMIDEESKLLFLHIREPEEITRAVEEFGVNTILVIRNTVKHITSNMADENVFNYNYDFVIENNGTKEELNNKAKEFVQEVIDMNNLMKNEYKFNTKFRQIVNEYCNRNKCTLEEAFKDNQIKQIFWRYTEV